MAELKPEVQKNIGASVKQVTGESPDIVALSARITPTRVVPSALSAALTPLGPALSRIAERRVVGEEGNVLGAFAEVEQFARSGVDWLDANPDDATQDLYNDEVRSKMPTQAIAVARKFKLNNKEFGQLMTQVKSLMADTYHTELFATKEGPGGILITTKDGKVVQSRFDAQTWAIEKGEQIREQFPTQFGVLLANSTGLEEDGTPMLGTPAEIRLRSERANFIIEGKVEGLAAMENASFEIAKLKAAAEHVGVTNEIESAITSRSSASFRSNFNKLGMVQMYEVMTRDGGAALQGPPEAAMAEFRAGLMNMRNSPEFVEFESHLRDSTLFDKEVDSLVAVAELIFTGKNMNIIKEFDVKTQDMVMRAIANDALLAQGKRAVATMYNSENMGRTINSAIQLNAFRRIEGAADTVLGATVLGIASGKGIDEMEIGLLHMNAESDPLRNTQRIAQTLGTLRREMNGLLDHMETGDGMLVTPHAMIEQINMIKSNKAFTRYMKSNNIPIAERQMIFDMVNSLEDQIIRVSVLTREDVNETRKRQVKIQDFWSTGIPEESKKTGE